jgi:ABC-type multidrug transport system fused ATPase/permease subunit
VLTNEANGNVSITQAVTFGAYAIAAKVTGRDIFSTAQAITAISIPTSFTIFACFKRIQDFLLLEERVETRKFAPSQEKSADATSNDGASTLDGGAMELQHLGNGAPIAITGGNFNWGERVVLQDINTALPKGDNGSLTAIVGPVGCGKSTLLKALLGETTFATDGAVSLSSGAISFCDQTPWIMNATVKANIVAESKGFDETWFDTVVEACDLSIDMGRFPEGTETVVGDKGLKLSGGQKQRIVS